ncbi:MAG: tRNA 2-selenouridine(34) synthase MnmH [Flavobacteriales bacterium]|nr:tRNA 2-selenouridine(34) synthase MnmH [Flavobacteriales bacterium]
MIKRISIKEYLKNFKEFPTIDVRSPGEFEKGHIPSAKNVPLFSNEERAVVGTIYKQESKEAAIEKGYEIVNPKLDYYISASLEVAPDKKIVVHCWRGGMRSASVGQHLLDNGFEEVYLIEGGYKAFRGAITAFFEQELKLIVLGGYTGSGKTEILLEIAKTESQVVDLEGLANHKGSAFGGIGQKEQPSTEHFQNILFFEMDNLDINKHIWIEDESSNIGKAILPKSLFNQIREQRVFFIDIPRNERAYFLTQTYGKQHKDNLRDSILRIQKRLGPQNTTSAVEALENNDLTRVAELSLIYYDKAYLRGVEARNLITEIKLEKVDEIENAKTLKAFVDDYYSKNN